MCYPVFAYTELDTQINTETHTETCGNISADMTIQDTTWPHKITPVSKIQHAQWIIQNESGTTNHTQHIRTFVCHVSSCTYSNHKGSESRSERGSGASRQGYPVMNYDCDVNDKTTTGGPDIGQNLKVWPWKGLFNVAMDSRNPKSITKMACKERQTQWMYGTFKARMKSLEP